MVARIIPATMTALGSATDLHVVPGANITTRLQAAINADAVVSISTPGTYYLSPSTLNPYYTASASYTCLLINKSNFHLVVGPGVTLKMADDTQNDTNNLCYMFVFRDRDGIKFNGGGTLDMNSTNQPDFTHAGNAAGPYDQECGGIIRGFFQHTLPLSAPGCTNVTVENLTLLNTFGNPVNIYCNRSLTAETNIHFRNLYCSRMGEGLQIVGAKNCSIKDCTVYDPDDVARGDALEFSDCRNFQCAGNIVRGAGNAGDQGSGIDIYLSQEGEIEGNTIDGWNNPLGCGWQAGAERNENVSITSNIFLNNRDGCAAPDGGNLIFANNYWIGITLGPPIQYQGSVDYPCLIASSGTTATVTASGHGFQTGAKVTIAGCTQTAFNGTYVVTRVDATYFTYTFAGNSNNPATGTPTYRNYRTAGKHIGDTFWKCTSATIVGDAEVDFIGCDFIDGVSHGITYEGRSGKELKGRVIGCKFIRNTGYAIQITSNYSGFAPRLFIVDNKFEDNGDTIFEDTDNGASKGLCVIDRNVGYPDPVPFDPSQIPDIESWYRSGLGLFQNVAKTIPALNTGDPVRVFSDSLGSGPDFVAPSDAERPIVDAGGGILGNGTSQHLTTAAGAFDASGPFTILVRYRARSIFPYTDYLLSVQKATGSHETFIVGNQGNTGGLYDEAYSGGVQSLSTSTGVDIVCGYGVASGGVTYRYHSDGTRTAGDESTEEDATSQAFLLAASDGASTPVATSFGVGPDRDILVIRRIITAAELVQIQDYFEQPHTAYNGDFWSLTNIPAMITSQPVFATGASHTVDELVAMLQSIGICRQS